MKRRVVAILLSLMMTFGFTLFFVEIAPFVKSSKIIYVDDEPGVGPSNPPENYTTIQAAIDAANPGDTVFVYNGTYFENINVSKTINLTGENRDSTKIVGNGIADVVHIQWDWVNLSGFTVTNGQIGIDMSHVGYNRIFNNIISINEHHGIELAESIGNNIYNNIVSNNSKGIVLSHSSYEYLANNITDNNVSGNDYGIFLSGSSGNNITDNIVDSNNDYGIDIGTSNNNRIINNNVSSSGRGGIWLESSRENILKDNTMKNNGIWIRGEALKHWNTHIIDTSNTVNGKPVQYWKNQTSGVVPAGAGQVILANCTNVSVEGQKLTHGTVGVELGFSFNNSITGNDVSSNSLGGIHLSSSEGNNIIGNNASLSIWEGIFLGGSDENSIIGNMAFSSLVGIRLINSSANQIIGNTLSSNSWLGLLIESTSSNNTIYHNNIIDNTFQARDYTNNGNYWDNGYPDGGNFWSDFDEPGEGAYDDFKGLNQDDPAGGDGIVDNGTVAGGGKNPYIIDPDSQDNYPLIYFGRYPFLYEGWNLISIPFIQPDTYLDKVLKPINGSYDAVQWYNVSDTNDHWKHNHILKPSQLNDLNDINHTMGFWIHITKPGGVIFEYNGTRPSQNQNITLHMGWNLVGFPSTKNLDVITALNNIDFDSELNIIQTYDALTKTWKTIGPSDYFEIGRGYWIHSNVEKVWNVPL